MQLHQQEPRAPRTFGAPSGGPWAPIVAVIALTATIGTIVLARALAPSQPDAEDLARSAADRFLDRYLEPDGRVVRRDQGGDTMSEGQAYAMLLAVATGDRRRFELAWSWARTHLQREDGLLSWRWEQGRVADANPASDADVDAAHALVLAAHRFRQPDYLQEGRRLARSILTEETVAIGDGTSALVAGPWARQEPYIINPSYFAPGSFAVLREATGAPQWQLLVRSSHQLVRRLTGDPPVLPPDWARLEHDGRAQPIASPSGAPRQPRFSFDAPRLLVRLAADCSRLSRDLAMAGGGLLPLEPGRVAARLQPPWRAAGRLRASAHARGGGDGIGCRRPERHGTPAGPRRGVKPSVTHLLRRRVACTWPGHAHDDAPQQLSRIQRFSPGQESAQLESQI